jgi:hypothetical protein
MQRLRALRSRLPAAVVGAVALGALVLPAGVSAAGTTARPADSLVESIGVNVHLGFDDTPYGEELGTLKQRLTELGVRHVRDGISTGRPDQYQALNELAGLGIGSTLILGDPDNGLSGLDELVGIVRSELAGVDAVEGPNEYSTRGGSEWKAKLIAYQERLYDEVKGDPLLASLPVIGPSIVHGDQEALGDVSGALDYGNVHSYPEANPPEFRMGSAVESAQLNSGAKPIMATETGYTNAINWSPVGPGENKPISEAATATYMPRLFFEYFSRHIARTFSYELVDEHPDPGLTEREDHFGLLRNDLSPKPAFEALRNTIEILEDPGPAFAPGALDYALSAGGATLHSSLLQKRDGTFYLALWRLQSVWSPDERKALPAPPEPVTITVNPGLQSYAVYSPTVSSAPTLSVSQPAGSLSVEVGPEVTIVALRPAADLPPAAPTALVAPPELRLVEPPAPQCVVPRLRGGRLKAARRKLANAHCRLATLRRPSHRQPGKLKVVGQRPRPGSVLPSGAGIGVILGR